MKKLLLTSDGLISPALGKSFLELVGKNPRYIKVLFVPTASEAYEDAAYLERKRAYFSHCEEELMGFGVQKEHMFWLDINNIASVGDISIYDVMYVCGGNTFYLLYEVKRTGFDKQIIEFVNNGKLYMGVSAGSVLAGPNIVTADPFDPNNIGLKDLSSLAITEKIICPHYQKEQENIILEIERKNNIKVLRLNDNQAWEETELEGKIIE